VLFLLDPHAKMPDMGLSRTEAADLAAYIATLKYTAGHSPAARRFSAIPRFRPQLPEIVAADSCWRQKSASGYGLALQ
jgi:hypothetical protein